MKLSFEAFKSYRLSLTPALVVVGNHPPFQQKTVVFEGGKKKGYFCPSQETTPIDGS